MGDAASVRWTSSRVTFVDQLFPLVLCVSPHRSDEAAVLDMIAGYERYLARGERYALISYSPKGAEVMGPRERKMVADWANEPRVRQLSRELCVGSATLVRNPLSRGALTAILWLWSPPSPHKAVATPDEAIDYALDRLAAERVVMPHHRGAVRQGLLPRMSF